nr:MAG TPA: N-acetylmuramoyl-L-alanine amidase [Caudoviricetes sp.]
MAYQFIEDFNSPNFGKYFVGETNQNHPEYICIHHWGMMGQSFMGVVNWLCNPKAGSSAHLVAEAGRVACIVSYLNVAWHTGVMEENARSIGIECRPECRPEDFETVAELIADIWRFCGRKIPLRGHCDIKPTQCPGLWYARLDELYRRAEYYYDTPIELAPLKKTIPSDVTITRYNGEDRYKTADLIAESHLKPNKVVVSGKTFADGLSAGYLAYIKKANLVYDECKGTNGLETTVVGGDVKINGAGVKVLSGADRYATNLEVLKECIKGAKKLIITSGKDWADGVSVSTVRHPVMMVGDYLTIKQASFLDKQSDLEYIILGGESVVSKDIERQLADIGKVTRLDGLDRYETSTKIADLFYPHADTVILVNAWADGLVASNLGDYPVLLVNQYTNESAKAYIKKHGIKKAFVLGDISDDILADIFN